MTAEELDEFIPTLKQGSAAGRFANARREAMYRRTTEKAHWTTVPTFWLVIISLLIAITSLVLQLQK